MTFTTSSGGKSKWCGTKNKINLTPYHTLTMTTSRGTLTCDISNIDGEYYIVWGLLDSTSAGSQVRIHVCGDVKANFGNNSVALATGNYITSSWTVNVYSVILS